MSLSLSASLLFLCLGEGGLLCHMFVIILLCIFYVLFILVSLKDVRAREKVRGDTNCFSYVPSQKKNKSGISGYGLIVVAYFQPATYIWCWQAGLEVGKPNNIRADNRRVSNGHSHGGHTGHSIRAPVACHSATETTQIYQRRKWTWSWWFCEGSGTKYCELQNGTQCHRGMATIGASRLHQKGA